MQRVKPCGCRHHYFAGLSELPQESGWNGKIAVQKGKEHIKYTYRHTLFACYAAYFTQAIVNNLTPLLFTVFQSRFGISFEQLGRLILLNFGVQLGMDLLSVRYMGRIGYRRAAAAAHLLCAFGLASLSVLPGGLFPLYPGLIAAVVLYALGSGLIEVSVSPIVNDLPGKEKESAMSMLHSFYCWGQVAVVLVTALLFRLAGAGSWRLFPALWALVPLGNLFLLFRVPVAPGVPEERRTPPGELFRSRFFRLTLAVMLCSGASELSMSQWASLFAEEGLGVSKLAGDLLGPCLFAVFMGLGRLLYGICGNRINLRGALLCCGAICLFCYLTAVFSARPLLSLMGCAVCGLGVSLMWPGTFSLAAGRYPAGGGALFGLLAAFGDLGGSLGPWVTGLVSDLAQRAPAAELPMRESGLRPGQFGLRCGLLAAALFPLALFLCVLRIRRMRCKTEREPPAE